MAGVSLANEHHETPAFYLLKLFTRFFGLATLRRDASLSHRLTAWSLTALSTTPSYWWAISLLGRAPLILARSTYTFSSIYSPPWYFTAPPRRCLSRRCLSRCLSQAMPLVAIKCANCAVKLGTVDNLWIQLGEQYLALVSSANHDLELETTSFGTVRSGEADTIVEGW